MNSKKVSIVIPVYDVEQYLSSCVDSVLEQSYKNLQIILVDDESTDRSGMRCDEYAKIDPRIQVIHKENGGLSDARNTGLAHVTGEFVFYLDSDDYLELDAIELLMKKQQESDADIVMGNYYYTYTDRHDSAVMPYPKTVVLSNQDAMKALVSGRLQNFAWGKLIRSEIAKKHEFPKGRLFEDNYWAHLVFAAAARVCISPVPLVFYRQREGSISYTYTIQRLDILDGWMDRKAFLDKNYPELTSVFLRHTSKNYLGAAWLVLTRMKEQKKQAFERLRTFSKQVGLKEYAEACDRDLIEALDKSVWRYAIKAIGNKLMKR